MVTVTFFATFLALSPRQTVPVVPVGQNRREFVAGVPPAADISRGRAVAGAPPSGNVS